MRERRTHGSVRGLRREPLVYSTVADFQSKLYNILHSREVFIMKIPRLILFSRRCVIELPRVQTVP